MSLMIEFGFDFLPAAASAIPQGIARLDQKARDDAVKNLPVIKPLIDEFDDSFDCIWGVLRIEFESNQSLRCIEGDRGF